MRSEAGRSVGDGRVMQLFVCLFVRNDLERDGVNE